MQRVLCEKRTVIPPLWNVVKSTPQQGCKNREFTQVNLIEIKSIQNKAINDLNLTEIFRYFSYISSVSLTNQRILGLMLGFALKCTVS